MEKQLTVTVPDVSGEEGLSQACREGRLFRNDPNLEDLYKDGFRIYNYLIEEKQKQVPDSQTRVKVFLKK
jgi:hypothetical protein